MLAIRMQRTGRKGHAQFRVVVQDSHFHPTRGRVVSYLGSYDPHTKTTTLDKEKANQYLSNGAQPSDRVIDLLKKEGVKLPDWVSASAPKKREVRNADKRRSTRPAGAPEPVAATDVSEEPAAEEAAEPAPAADEAPAPAEETPAPEAEASTQEESAPEAEAPAEPEQPAETPQPEAPADASTPDAE